jgi:transposase InsO family protein
MGIKHQLITPRHPRANGLVENFNRMVKKVTPDDFSDMESDQERNQ